MSMIKVYEVGTIEYEKLMFFSKVANRQFAKNKKHFFIEVTDCWFDYGQKWMYTALITEDFKNDSSWQSVCPRDYEKILNTDSFNDIYFMAVNYAEHIMMGKICVGL